MSSSDVDNSLDEASSDSDMNDTITDVLKTSIEINDIYTIRRNNSTPKEIKSNIINEPRRDTNICATTPISLAEIEQKSRKKIGRVFIIAIFCYIFYIFYHNCAPKIHHNAIILEKNNECNAFKELKIDFPNQDEILWKSLKVGVESVINNDPTKPTVFLFAYYDTETSKLIMERIIDITAKCLNSKNKPLLLTAKDFSSDEMQNDYGVAIETYKIPLKESGILAVSDIDKIPSSVAEAFHSFCDTITPLVDRSVIYLTHPIINTTDFGNYVDTNLRSVWREIEKNKLEALITRVTDQILLFKTEKQILMK